MAPRQPDLTFRSATSADASGIATLHTESWRRNYRGAYSDSFLDGEVPADRLAVWTRRLSEPGPGASTFVAEAPDGLVGFAHVVFDDDPTWGALLDNLHVTHPRKGSGIGTSLMAMVGEAVLARPDPTGLYLWVLEQNVAARAFYDARGGKRIESAKVSPPGGVGNRLNGSPRKFRYAWDDPSTLVA